MNDRMVASMLNEARSCGMFVEELGDLITEYFASDVGTPDDSSGSAAGKIYFVVESFIQANE